MTLSPLVRPDEPMSWEQFEALGENSLAEYIDGRLVVSPSPCRQHQRTVHRLVTALESVVPEGLAVTAGWSWKPRSDEFIPDVMVHPETAESVRFTGSPVLVVEVLSTNRADDLVVKTGKYAALGVSHYWVADPTEPSLSAFTLTDAGLYTREAHLTSGASGDVPFGGGSLLVDVDALFSQ
ncbi:MAG: Uma2 family endonuclease [Actinomycetes bacterium]